MRKQPQPILFMSDFPKEKEWFAVKPTNGGDKINFWQVTDRTYFYTIEPTEIYNRKGKWTEDLCRQLAEELKKENPEVSVIRFAIDGNLIISPDDGKYDDVPKMPGRSARWSSKQTQLQKRAKIEEAKSATPAPFILYAKHSEHGATEREFAWQLTPDKPKRQNIQPGDKVLVWTKFGYKTVTVTRIEEAGEKEQPCCRVKRKIEECEE